MKRLFPAFLLALTAGCAITPDDVGFDALRAVREERFPTVGKWGMENGTLANVLPEGASRRDLEIRRDGAGVSMGVIDGFVASDFVMEAEMSFTGNASAEAVFRVRESQGVVSSMYSLVLCKAGIVLWRMKDGEWRQLHAHVFAITPGEPHVLRAKVVGDRIAVAYDGKAMFETQDDRLMVEGGIGVCARGGICRFHGLRFTSLDS